MQSHPGLHRNICTDNTFALCDTQKYVLVLYPLTAAVLSRQAWNGSSEITVQSLSCHLFVRHTSPASHRQMWLIRLLSVSCCPLFYFHFLSPQQPNIKQKFVALLKRFKVTDEVGAVLSLCAPLISLTYTLPLHVRGSECVFAEINMHFGVGFEDTERCVGEMWQNNWDPAGSS